eukprot:12843782-Alexandrium_andersonii.AAC.1
MQQQRHAHTRTHTRRREKGESPARDQAAQFSAYPGIIPSDEKRERRDRTKSPTNMHRRTTKPRVGPPPGLLAEAEHEAAP